MLEIDVYLGLDTVTPPIAGAPAKKVEPDLGAAHSGDDIIWHIHSLDDTIEYVQVEFDSGVDFFDKRGGGKTHKRHAKVEKPGKSGGHGHVFGISPSFGGGTQANKYTVKAYDGNPDSGGKIISKYTIDPTIVTCDP